MHLCHHIIVTWMPSHWKGIATVATIPHTSEMFSKTEDTESCTSWDGEAGAPFGSQKIICA